ncbi:MAG: tetratricopeptide repeat protein [Candidatus Manganitrophaceae bacterium]|nr:MAG: tetratricopeptide repeat protein [Candidatus Manganitrophaceae bacterium]
MIPNAFQQLGNNAFAAGDYSAALRYYQKALDGSRGDPDQLADLYGNIGNVYGATGQIEQAIDCYKKAVEILRRGEDYARLGITYVNIGNLHADRGEVDQAVHFYKQGALLLEREKRWENLIILYGNFSMTLLKKSELSQALDYAEKGMALAKQLNRPALLADASHRLAKAKGANGEIDQAQRLSESAQALYAGQKNEMGCAATLYHQTSLHEQKGNLEGAIRCLEQVVAIDEKYGLPKLNENQARLSRLRVLRNSSSPQKPT